jgi:hypothetical protein
LNGATPYIARESLVSNEWRVSGCAFKPFMRFGGPPKKITFMD